MGANDVIDLMLPYLIVFFCIMFVICCFMKNCYCGMTARELREISEHHEERLRQNEIRLAQQIEARRQRENKEMEEAFRLANIDRLELADSLTKYAKYLRGKMERERIEEEEDIVIFVNPGHSEPVLGQLMTD